MVYFEDFISIFQENYEILVTDASKSYKFTAITGCSFTAQFSYRIHYLNSVFTTEALAIGIAIDELALSGHPFLLSDSLSILIALQEVAHSSPKVILWLHQKVLHASTLTSSIFSTATDCLLFLCSLPSSIDFCASTMRFLHNIDSF